MTNLDVACVLYDEFTLLDIVGPFQILSAAGGFDLTWVAESAGPVHDHTRTTTLEASAAWSDVADPDIVIVPGGLNTSAHFGGPIGEWLRSVHPRTAWTTSVCTGSLLLADAGLLDGVAATGHWCAMETLGQLGATPTAARVVIDSENRIVTGAGVSAGIDMALALVAHIRGESSAQMAQLALEYDPQPPTDAGSPAKAPAEIAELVASFLANSL